jgi:hypothetical protein
LHDAERFADWGNARLAALDHFQFRSLNPYPCIANVEAGVRDDGTLWYWDEWKDLWGTRKERPPASKTALPELLQIGKDSNWAAVASGFYQLVALKTDGTIWRWKLIRGRNRNVGALQEAPERLGTHQDWVALGCWLNQSVALAADGTFWRLPRNDVPWGWGDDSEGWLAPSRRHAKSGLRLVFSVEQQGIVFPAAVQPGIAVADASKSDAGDRSALSQANEARH